MLNRYAESSIDESSPHAVAGCRPASELIQALPVVLDRRFPLLAGREHVGQVDVDGLGDRRFGVLADDYRIDEIDRGPLRVVVLVEAEPTLVPAALMPEIHAPTVGVWSGLGHG